MLMDKNKVLIGLLMLSDYCLEQYNCYECKMYDICDGNFEGRFKPYNWHFSSINKGEIND